MQLLNATKAYQRAYGVKNQFNKLKKQLHSDMYVEIDDIINEYTKQAFASLGEVLDYKVNKEIVVDRDGNVFLDTEDNPVEKHTLKRNL